VTFDCVTLYPHDEVQSRSIKMRTLVGTCGGSGGHKTLGLATGNYCLGAVRRPAVAKDGEFWPLVASA
jgi:hypothetical protein